MPHRFARLVLLMAGLALLAACTPAGMYATARGPYPVGHADGLVLAVPGAPRPVPFRVAYPDAPGRYPVVVFSHGAFCAPQNYAVITDQWVAHGYVVVLPDHPDSLNSQPPLRPDQMGNLTATRVGDMDALLGNLPEVARLAGIEGRLDTGRLAVAGHSYGTVIAMAKAGLWLRGADGQPERHLDARLKGAVLLSGVGPMADLMAPDAFAGLAVPLIATGGTLDVGNTGGPVIHPWEWRMSPFTLAPPGDKYSVVLERGDHYLGGLMCRPDRGGDDDPSGAAIDGTLTLAFLDAYLRGDARAARFLRQADLSALTAGRARLERR